MTRVLMIGRDCPARMSDPEADVTVRQPEGFPDDLRSPVVWACADLAVLATGLSANEEGFDAVVAADAGDFGAGALRSVLDVPVVAAGRSAMLYALTLGSTFAVVSRAYLGHRMRKQVQEFGLASHCTSVIEVPDRTAGDELSAGIDGIAADVLVLAGSFNAAEAELLREAVNRPVIEPAPLALKLALGFLALDLTHSARSYPAPQHPRSDLIQALARRATDG